MHRKDPHPNGMARPLVPRFLSRRFVARLDRARQAPASLSAAVLLLAAGAVFTAAALPAVAPLAAATPMRLAATLPADPPPPAAAGSLANTAPEGSQPALAPPAAARVRAALGTGAFAVEELSLPRGLPERFAVDVPREGIARRLLLTRRSLRTPGAFVRVVQPDGTSVALPPPPARTYRGFVEGDPECTVLASLDEDGLRTTVVESTGTLWSIVPLRSILPAQSRALHAVLEGAQRTLGVPGSPARNAPAAAAGTTGRPWAPIEMPGGLCGADLEGLSNALPPPPAPARGLPHPAGTMPAAGAPPGPPGLAEPWGPSRCLQLCEIAFDADYDYFQLKGGTVAGTVAAIDGILDQVDFFYARDLRVTYRITAYVVRTAPFYFPTSGGDLLSLFQAEWNTNQAGVPRDVAHLMTGKPGSLIQYGGLAYVGVVCNLGSAYGWSMDGANIVGHEMGHNWGAGHCLDPTPCNNMCGACFFIAPKTKLVMEAYIATVSCLEPAPGYPPPLPPYAQPEGVAAGKADYGALSPTAFDVLANDHDANCDPVRIAGFDGTSALGGTVVLSPGTGSKGQAELVYTPPPTPFLGRDQFQYTAADWYGGTMAGTVTIDVRPQRLEAYWPLDDGAGSTATDATGLGFDGTLSGGPAWIPGPFGGALAFDGTGDDVAVPPMNLQTDTLSITAWLRLDGPQTQQPGIVFSRDASTAAGLSVAIGDELRYEWDGILWKSGLVVPQGIWTFVALVVEPARATIWMDDGTGLRSATNAVPHGVEEFDGTLRLGWDEKKPTRRLFGALDDVRIHGWALDAQDIADLAQRGGPAVVPIPTDGGTLADTTPSVSWTPGLLATSHDVFFGTDYTAVDQATRASPEFQGNFLAASFPVGVLASGTTYFWRADEIAGGPAVTGQTWQFQPADYHHWRLDETSGTVAADSHGTLDGLYIAGPQLGVPGATPKTATAVDFDGVIQHVYLPAMNLASDHVSITSWVRRSGTQSPFAGLVFSRAMSTVAGLNVGNANDLGYHWNDDQGTWGWSSGLVLPDQKWVFVALVVEPSRATIWMGEDGVLTSAVNAVPHAIEEFDGPTEIARDAAGGRLFRGRVDDVRVYDGALTPAEIRDLYQGLL